MAFFAKAANISDQNLQQNVMPKMMKMIELMNEQTGPGVPGEVEMSPLHGEGLFATRDVKKGEVFPFTMADFEKLAKINDGAILNACPLFSLPEMKEFYCNETQRYSEETIANRNCKLIKLEDPNNPQHKLATFVITRDIKSGDEFLRSYGVAAWICMMPSRLYLPNAPIYRQWVIEEFPQILSNSNESESLEAMTSMLNGLI